MYKADFSKSRQLKEVAVLADITVVGGGLSGVCAALSAAREGLSVCLVQDRPVLGGNASSEVRLWVLGATSHMGNNNRWAREGGIVDEILVENMYRNPEGNPLILDTILAEKIQKEENITLLLNTAVYEVEKCDDLTIRSLRGFCSQNSTSYLITSPFFCDASGDGVVGFLSGASFRMGAESREEFGEKFAPSKEYGELLGHSLYFYTRDTGKPVKYVAPSYAIDVTKTVPRYRNFKASDYGCRFWWIEYGGRLDTVHDTEKIKWELWKIVYGVWDYIKNSGKFPEAETLTLEWVGTIPGKRESRRFEGDYMLKQQDLVEQRHHYDAVSYGGWSLDLHPSDGIYSELPGCNQWHTKGVYQIPFRSLYSKDVQNLFFAGRVISATHVAHASTRVMGTCANSAQVIGPAAAICLQKGLLPHQLAEEAVVAVLQKRLVKNGQYIPGFSLVDEEDLVQRATLWASSELGLKGFSGGHFEALHESVCQMLPFTKGTKVQLELCVKASCDTVLETELRISSNKNNHTPDVLLESQNIPVAVGEHTLTIDFSADVPLGQYAYIIFKKNKEVLLPYSEQRVSGILSLFNTVNEAVSNYGAQKPAHDIGVDTFEFWCPKRRPKGQNLAFYSKTEVHDFSVNNITNPYNRPISQPNAWVAAWSDKCPSVHIQWDKPRKINRMDIFFDADYDHPMETVLMGHPENVMPFCVRNYKVSDQSGKIIYEKKDNYHSMNSITFPPGTCFQSLKIELEHPGVHYPASLFSVRCY